MLEINLIDYIDPIDSKKVMGKESLHINQWGNQIAFFDDKMENWEQYDIALFDIPDPRLDFSKKRKPYDFTSIRRELYKLYNWHETLKVVDLGSIKKGKTVGDTLTAVEDLITGLLQNQVIPIFLCPSQEATYAQLKAYEPFGRKITAANFDERIDLHLDPDQQEEPSYIFKMLAHQPHLLESYYQLAFQNFLVNPTYVKMLEQKHSECYRLGYFLEDISRLEPFLRATDMVSLDLSVVKYADAPGQPFSSPNGMTSYDVCVLARYAGISDQLSSFGVYNFSPEIEEDSLTAQLIAQIIWHFVDGFYGRKYEKPKESDEENYIQYKVAMNNYWEEITFLKSTRSERWWMKVPIVDGKEEIKFKILPCLEEEYQLACKREIPERWMSAFLKYST